jgi:hypothetical protein
VGKVSEEKEEKITSEQRKKILKAIEEAKVGDENFSGNKLFMASFMKTAGIAIIVFFVIILIFFLIMWLK